MRVSDLLEKTKIWRKTMLGLFEQPTRCLIVAGLCSIAASGTAQAQDYTKVTLRSAQALPESYPPAAATAYFNERLAEESGGDMTVNMFWGGVLGGDNEALPLVSKGAVDISGIVPGYFNTQLPLMSMTNALPHTFFDPEYAMRALAKMSSENADLNAEYEAVGIKPLVFRFLPNYQFYCTSPVQTMEDIEGLKVRSFGNYIPRMMESLGAVPVNVTTADVYEALNRGSLDCSYSPMTDAASFKLHEVAEYLIDLPMGGIAANVDVMNLETFNSLSPDSQELITKLGAEATDWWAEQSQEKADEALQTMKEGGLEVVEFKEADKLRETVPDMVSIWQDVMTERGMGDVGASYSEALMDYYNANATE
ncbi:C4-dicarboxylate TRAP transporter substrate-binding protein [Vreelandella titanicae]|uniref:C4-dicarboxylate TRAP transporter substrate-binding protein n=1 Tax=Vreelandella titanicae TaxID=664683 RepID=UPI00315A77CB